MDAPRYRIGNDLSVFWAIHNRDGSPFDMEGMDVRLFVTNERGRMEVKPILTKLQDGTINNVIRWDYKGEDQRILGLHTLTVEISESENHREITKDYCEAFTLVSRSELETDEEDANINIGGELILASKLDIYRFEQVSPDLTDIKITINGIQKEVNDIGTEMTTKASVESVVEIGNEVEQVRTNVAEQTIRVDSMSAEIATKASSESVTKIGDELSITNKTLAGQVVKVSELESEVSTKASAESVTKVEDDLAIASASLAEQTLKVNALEAEIKTKASTESVTQVEGQLATVNQTVAEQIIRTDGIEASIGNLVTKETFNATTGEIEQRFTSVKQTTDSIETTIRSQEGEIASIKENVNGLSVGIGKVESDLDSLKNQIDGVTESFFYDYTPTLENEPAASWIENGTEAEHRGDTFTNTALTGEGAGKSWRWLQDENGNWGWTPIADTDAQKALLLASQAQATADGKCSTFHVQPSNYSIGDIWFVHNDDYAPYKKGEILTATKAGTVFSLSDWESLTRYSQAVDDLDAEMKGAFRDGVIDDAERKAIAEGLNALKSEKSGIDAGYNIVIINSDLAADTELKTEFKAAKTAYDGAYNALVAMVEEIINADLEELKELFEEYNTLSNAYSQAVADYLDCKERVTEALMGRLNPASVYIDNITSDGKLTPIEKEQLFEIYRNIAREYDTNRGNAFNYKIWQYASDGVSEMQGNNGGNGRYETYTAYKESYAPIVSVFTSSIWGFEKMDETTTLPDGYSTTQLKQYLDAYYAARGELVEIFSAITAAIEDAQKAAEQTLSELTGILKPEEMTTLIGKGVVLSTIIATKDAKGNITAGMNAAYEHAHPQYGRIVFAGGVADLSDWNSASFRVYETGHVVMQSGQVGESVKLGRAMLNSVLAGDIDLLSYPENGKLIPLFQVNKDDSGNIISISSVYDLYVNGNLVVKGDSSSGGTGQDTPAIGTVTGVEVNGIKYTDVSAGILDLSDAFNNVSVDLSNYYTRKEVDDKIAGIDFSPYATTTYVNTAIANLINGAPSTLDTLKEIADALADNADVVAALDAAIGTKADASALEALGQRVTTDENNIATLFSTKADKATTLAGYGIKDAYTKTETDNLLKKYLLLEAASQTIKGDIRIEGNLVVTGDSSSGGSGEDTPAIGTVTGIKVNGQTYNPTAGIVTIPDYPTTLEWDAIGGKPSFAAVATSGKYSDLSGRPTIPSLDGYATEKWVTDKGYATATALSSGLSTKVDKVSGKGLSTNDFTTTLLNKLNGIASGAQVNVQSDWNATSGDAFIKNKPTIPTVPTKVSAFTNDAGYLTSHQEVKNTSNTLSFGSAIIIGSVGGTNLTAALPSVASVKSTLGLGNLAYKSSLVASDIPDLSSKYLPLTGGTISGMLELNTSDTDEVGIELSVNGISKGWLGYAEDIDYGTCLYNYACDKYLGIKDDGTPHYNGYTLLHSGNVGNYALPITGGTIEGHLTIGVDGSTTAQHLLRMYRMNGTTRNRLLAGILDDNSIELSYYSPTSGGYGRLVLGASTYKVGNSTLYDIIHSGNIGSYKAGDSDKLGGRTLAWVQGNGLKIRRVKTATSASPADANVDLEGGGMIYSYSNTLSLTNGPSGMGYGHVWQVGSYGNDVLDGQFAWDNNHDSQEDTTGKLWWRSRDSVNGWTYAKWHQIAFTDSNVASATKLATARTIWGQSFDGTGNIEKNTIGTMRYLYFQNADNNAVAGYVGRGGRGNNIELIAYNTDATVKIGAGGHSGDLIINPSGNVTIGNSDLAGTDYKLFVHGKTKFISDANNYKLYTRINESGIQVGRTTANYTGGYNGGLSYGEDDTILGYIAGVFNDKNANSTHFFYGGPAGSAALYIKNGNVLIGTTEDNGSGARLQVAGNIHATRANFTSYIYANSFRTEGENGIWKGDTFTSSLTATDLVIKGDTVRLIGDLHVIGNLIVTGDSSSGGTGEGASVLHGPVSVNVPALLLLNGDRNVTQATMDGYGLTQAVVANMLAGMYTKVTHTKDGGYKDVYSYDGNEDSTYITIFIRQGDSFDINTGMVLRYVRSSQTWQVSMNEI